jgi:hypothetical protein
VTDATDSPTPWLQAAVELDRWMAERDYAGHDPHDFLASPLVRAATLGNRWAAIAWTQIGRRLPFQLRHALRVPAARNPKGIGLVLAAQVRLAEAEGEVSRPTLAGADPRPAAVGADPPGGPRIARVRELVRWLDGAADRSYGGAGWGYPFPWANRDFMAPAGTPSSVATAFVGHALLDAAERLGLEEARTLAAEAGTFLTTALQRIPGPGQTFCFSYTPLDRRAVHNASLLSASLLSRLGTGAGPGPGPSAGSGAGSGTGADASANAGVDAGPHDAHYVHRAVEFSLRAQRADGAWPYGVGRRNQWVDSFHTGYILLALDGIGRTLRRTPRDQAGNEEAGNEEAARELAEGELAARVETAVERGISYWRGSFFQGPAVGTHPGERFPVDAHAVAQAILTFVGLRHRIPEGLGEARRLAGWAVAEMRDPQRYYHYKHHGRWRNRLPYMRWVQSWMLLALAELAALDARAGSEDGERGEGGGARRGR